MANSIESSCVALLPKTRKMGKKGKQPDKQGAKFSGVPQPEPVHQSAPPGTGEQGSRQAGLVVFWQKNSAPYIAVQCFVALVLLLLLLASPSLPRLLCHFSLLAFTLFCAGVVGLRCHYYFSGDEAAQERLAWLIFWCLLMVHGLACLSCALVLARGNSPGVLWRAFGEHGGSHLDVASLGAVPLMVLPPLLLIGFMAYERKFLVCIFHDFFHATGGRYKNAPFQLCSPLLPLAFWAALLRPPLFTDLPLWPSILELLGVCALANGPVLVYIYYSTRNFYGPAHWIPDGGCAVLSLPPSIFKSPRPF